MNAQATIQIRAAKMTKTKRGIVMYTIIATGKQGATFIPNALLKARASELEAWIAKSLGLVVEIKPKAAPVLEGLEGLLEEINDAGDYSAKLWEKGGQRRVYVKLLRKDNGGKTWNQGLGAAWCVNLVTKTTEQTLGWAGAKTRNNWEDDVAELLERILNA
jgi:hypothetical protein